VCDRSRHCEQPNGSKRACAVTLIVALTAGSISISAQIKESAPPVLPGQTESEFTIKDFRFKSGEVLPELRLHYVTLGTPRRNSAGEIV
jgi:homoserine O-acetyltransferase/O-succinyltransferase